MKQKHIIIEGKKIILDEEGFLLRHFEWNQNVALHFAKEFNLELTEAHFEIIFLIRDFYQTDKNIPSLRIFIHLVKTKLGKEKGKSTYLYQLFPGNPLKYLCKIAGLPKPKHCM